MIDIDKLKDVDAASKTTQTTKVHTLHKADLVKQQMDSFPELSSTAREFLDVRASRYANAETYSKVFEKDQSLTAKLLRVANSSFYQLRQPVTTIASATTILGDSTLKSIVFANYCSSAYADDATQLGYIRNGLLIHSIAVAVIARKLTRSLTNYPAEVAEALYVVGLLHDIGKAVLVGALEPGDPSITDCESGTSVLDYEQDLFGTDHTAIAHKLISSWNLPDPLPKLITQHHLHENLEDDQANKMASLLRLAHYLANKQGHGLNPGYQFENSLSGADMTYLNSVQEITAAAEDAWEEEIEQAVKTLT